MTTAAEVRDYLAAEVRAAMGRHEITRTQLATELGISIQTLSESLAGRRAFDVNELVIVCSVLHLDFASLFPAASPEPKAVSA